MTVKILTVGDKSSPAIADLITDYEKRLPRFVTPIWQLVPPGKADIKTSMRAEAESLLKKVSENDYVLLLDENGTQLSSPAFSKILFSQTRDIVIIIGGAYGVEEAIKKRANFTLSLSKLVFPHQLVRLILAEQLYRAAMIHANHPYHHQ